MRRGSLLGVLLLASAVAAMAQGAQVVVEDWSKTPVGQKGVPTGWKTQSWGNPKYEFEVVSESPSRVLHLISNGDSSTISKEIDAALVAEKKHAHSAQLATATGKR